MAGDEADHIARALDPAARGGRDAGRAGARWSPWSRLFGTGIRGLVLRGDWLGHAVHPLLTDVVLGTWTSASVLDLLGGPDWSAPPSGSSAPVCSLPADGLDRMGRVVGRRARVKAGGLVHAVTNGVAISVYAASWSPAGGAGTAPEPGSRSGAAVSGAGAYLGGHLTEAQGGQPPPRLRANANANANANASMVV